MRTLWDKLDRVRIITANADVNYLRELYDAVRISGLNINQIEWFIWVKDQEQEALIRSKLNCAILSKKKMSWLNRIKDKEIRAKWERSCPSILVFGTQPEEMKKLLRAKKNSFICSINENLSFAHINLTIENSFGYDQVQFVKNTLEKINSYG